MYETSTTSQRAKAPGILGGLKGFRNQILLAVYVQICLSLTQIQSYIRCDNEVHRYSSGDNFRKRRRSWLSGPVLTAGEIGARAVTEVLFLSERSAACSK